MYLPLIIFFLSLAGIIIMIWRELILVKNNQFIRAEYPHPFVHDLEKIKHLTFKSIKKLGYIILFLVLRFFIKFSNFIKIKTSLLIKKLKSKFIKSKKESLNEAGEAGSKYLKIISDYKHKIRKMKKKIKEEEGIE